MAALVAAMSTGCVPLCDVAAPQPRLAAAMPPADADTQSPLLVVHRVPSAPIVDGTRDELWNAAGTLTLPLHRQSGPSHEPAGEVQLAATYHGDNLYLLARWPGPPPLATAESEAITNRLTVHWRIPEGGGASPACTVACHTFYADAGGRLAWMRSETVPSAAPAELVAAGGWRDGWWMVEWSRPLRENRNPYDLQITNLQATYPFFVKVFEHSEGRSDPVSPMARLIFAPPSP